MGIKTNLWDGLPANGKRFKNRYTGSHDGFPEAMIVWDDGVCDL
jgi:hypothetical protein